MEQFLAILNELSAAALAAPSTAALIGGGAALVLVLLMVLGQSGRLRRLRKTLEAERQSRVKLDEAVGSVGQTLEALSNELGQYQGRLVQLESDKQNQARRIDELSDKLNAQQNINSQLEQRLAQADALLKDQNTQLNSRLTQYQALLDSARQAHDTRIAELGQQMEQMKQGLAALQEQRQPQPSPVAAAEVAPELETELEQNNAPAENLGEPPAGVEPPVSPLLASPGSSPAAIAPSPQVVLAMEPEAPAAKHVAPVAEPAKPAPIQAESVPAAAKKGLFGWFGKKTAAPDAPLASQEKPAAIDAAPEPTPVPEPLRAAPPVQAEAKQGLFGGKSAPVQAAAPAPAPAPEASEPEKATVTKALLSFMADDLKKGTGQLKGLFKFGGKK
ncbi:MAG: hypothetical protein EPN21_18065 [Methylococcaceae bacterium]|nr:MAG: hypothetical protein EPN21_18065 [Methylococcaceae bacterium]